MNNSSSRNGRLGAGSARSVKYCGVLQKKTIISAIDEIFERAGKNLKHPQIILDLINDNRITDGAFLITAQQWTEICSAFSKAKKKHWLICKMKNR